MSLSILPHEIVTDEICPILSPRDVLALLRVNKKIRHKIIRHDVPQFRSLVMTIHFFGSFSGNGLEFAYSSDVFRLYITAQIDWALDEIKRKRRSINAYALSISLVESYVYGGTWWRLEDALEFAGTPIHILGHLVFRDPERFLLVNKEQYFESPNDFLNSLAAFVHTRDFPYRKSPPRILIGAMVAIHRWLKRRHNVNVTVDLLMLATCVFDGRQDMLADFAHLIRFSPRKTMEAFILRIVANAILQFGGSYKLSIEEFVSVIEGKTKSPLPQQVSICYHESMSKVLGLCYKRHGPSQFVIEVIHVLLNLAERSSVGWEFELLLLVLCDIIDNLFGSGNVTLPKDVNGHFTLSKKNNNSTRFNASQLEWLLNAPLRRMYRLVPSHSKHLSKTTKRFLFRKFPR